MAQRVLVTGALGCIGAWTVRALLDAGSEPVGYDLGGEPHRLRLVLGDDLARVILVTGDITDLAALERALDEHEIDRVIHLAALQVPFCMADPSLGARVNVVGSVNVFEATKRRLARIPGVVYASSAAVYAADDPSPAPEPGGTRPTTHYGVYKVATEGSARVYWADHGVASVGIRPYVVYGLGRDQGMTSTPTQAMAAAAHGERFEISYGGVAQYDYAPDVGRAFAQAARTIAEGAGAYNFGGERASMREVVQAIEAAAPESAGLITWLETPLPFPPTLESGGLDTAIGPVARTTLAEGVRETIARFRES